MKPVLVLAAASWFAASVWAGYALAARSFAWVDEPRFGLPAPDLPRGLRLEDVDAILFGLPKTSAEAAERVKELSPKAQACLIEALGETRVRAALEDGEFRPTGADLVAAMPCLSL